MDSLCVMLYLVRSKISRGAQGICIQYGARAELKSLETLVCIGDIIAHQHNTVILHDYRFVVRIFGELSGYFLSKQFAAWQCVGGKSDWSAHAESLRQYGGIGNLLGDTEGHQSRRVCMNHAVKIGADFVQRPVKRILGRWFVWPYDGAVRLHAHNVCRGEGTFIYPGGGNPHIPVFIHNGKIATGSGGHPASVDAPDNDGNLLCRMHKFDV